MHTNHGTEAEQLVAAVRSSLDDCDATGELARRAYRSRSNFYRLFAHVMTFNAYRRLNALDALRRLDSSVPVVMAIRLSSA